MENNQMNKKKAEQKKQRRKVTARVVTAVVVFLLAVMPMLAAKNDAAQEQQASILSGTVETGSIDTQIVGGGRLASETAIKLKIPEEVKLAKYLVGNGDTVSKGDAIAEVDRVSVMTAITGVQETLDELSKEILDAENDEAASTVKARVGGTVKVIYAQPGESAQDVMLEHGALAAVSLDDVMAVKVRRQSGLDAGDMVCVSFPDGTEADGRVEQNLEGVLTITMEDDDYAVETEVTVLTQDGDRLGSGNLYIFNQWNATAYSGTVSQILVKEGTSLYSGQQMIRLEDPGHTAEFQRLIDKRQEYEALMQELFQMYRTETITAPCDGIVSGVDKDGAFLLSDTGRGYVLDLLTSLVHGRQDMFEAHGVRVESVTADGMQLQVDGNQTWVEDLSDLSDVPVVPGKMTHSWDYSGETTVYVQSADGLLQVGGTASPGDLLVAVGDSEQVYWFVRAEERDSSETPAAETEHLMLLSDEDGETSADITLHLSNNQGTAKERFTGVLTAMDGEKPLSGEWSIDYNSSPGWLSLSGDVVSGTPAEEGAYNVTLGFVAEDGSVSASKAFTIYIAAPAVPEYVGIVAAVTGVGDGVLLVKQSGETIAITDPENLPAVVPDMQKLTEPASYISNLIKSRDIAEDDVLLLILDAEGSLYRYVVLSSASQDPGNAPQQGTGMPGGMPSGGMGGGMSGGMMPGTSLQEEDPYYSLEKLTIASVTSQEHMAVEITVDELDISGIYIGQPATVTMDALAGESFAATVSKIANSGENEGGNSKFTVELTLEKSGDMLPGMTASARIVLDTVQDVLCIPVAALAEENGKTVVFTSYDSENGVLGDPVEVTLGAADADRVQVLSGLASGVAFYYAYYDTLEEAAMPPMGAMPFG